MEYLRAPDKKIVPLDDVLRQTQAHQPTGADDREEKEIKEKMLACLERCTGKLEAASREIITGYYFGKERVKIRQTSQLDILEFLKGLPRR